MTAKFVLILTCVPALALAAATDPPPMPTTPAAVEDVLYARTFELANATKFIGSPERPTFTEGTILVLKVDPAYVQPRQIAMPVLYAGDHTALRINQGHESGFVIAIVPAAIDLAKEPIWFGTPDFPHVVNRAMVRAERRLAEQAGIQPFEKNTVDAATKRGGDNLHAPTMRDLLRTEVADLILEYSPQESQLAEDFRVPVVTKKKSRKKNTED
jgi:hypothetical protein